MHKETITYVDFDGETRTEEFYFNLTERDCLKMQTEYEGGYYKFLLRIIAENNHKRIFESMEDLVQRSYGVKSTDGRRHIKNPEVLADFIDTRAYSDLIMKLATDANAAAAFVNGIFPADMVKNASTPDPAAT